MATNTGEAFKAKYDDLERTNIILLTRVAQMYRLPNSMTDMSKTNPLTVLCLVIQICTD